MKQPNIWSLIANLAIPLGLLLVMSATSVQAALREHKTTSASNLRMFHGRLMVAKVAASYDHIGLRAGDQIVAVNGRRVSTEAAYLKSLATAKNGAQATNVSVVRNGQIHLLQAPVPSLSGYMNPNLMVMTSQGVMHRDAAARLGLVGTPINGSSEGP